MIRALAFIAAIAAPLPGLALSCLPYGPVDAFWAAAESEDRYVVVRGRLDFNPARLPVVDWEKQEETPPLTTFNASFAGFSLTQEGFTARFVRTIRAEVACYGPWCSTLVPGAEVLGFLRKDGSSYVLATDPCGGFAFTNPTEEMVNSVVRCFRGGPCEPTNHE